jgi:two-component system, NtrC family, sensor kinase
MTDTCEHIDVDEFDREYGLADLLPPALARELLADIDSRCSAAINASDGCLYFLAGGPQLPEVTAELKRRARQDGAAPRLFSVNGRRAGGFILTHELETIGFLVLETDAEHGLDDELLLSTGRFAARCINRVINFNYRNRMTAGLHGQVVADSYESLKIKAAQLARSEEKYRLLAENLELEVEKKTREIKAAQLRLLQQEKMASIGQLAAGMAHEINNPVGFVISNLNTLRESTSDLFTLIDGYRKLTALLSGSAGNERSARDIKKQMADISALIEAMDLDFVVEDTASLIEESLDGAKRVKIIVQNLRDFTHPSIDAPESLDFNRCLDTTLAMLSGFAAPEIKINRHYGEIPEISARLREINQVFFNVLKNAFQAVGDRGEITIATTAEDDAVTVRITDNGPGIAPKDQGKIFDPFFTTREVGGGTGLGLFQAYSTVKRHGGSIAVDSVEGQGSCFVIRLPKTRPVMPQEDEPAVGSAGL